MNEGNFRKQVSHPPLPILMLLFSELWVSAQAREVQGLLY